MVECGEYVFRVLWRRVHWVFVEGVVLRIMGVGIVLEEDWKTRPLLETELENEV